MDRIKMDLFEQYRNLDNLKDKINDQINITIANDFSIVIVDFIEGEHLLFIK